MTINPVAQLLMTRRAELNAALAEQELLFRRGKISFEVYNETTKKMIKDFYVEQEKYSAGDDKDINKDSEPTGLFGLTLRGVKKIFS